MTAFQDFVRRRNAELVALYRDNPAMTLEKLAAFSVKHHERPVRDIAYLSRMINAYGASRPRKPRRTVEHVRRERVAPESRFDTIARLKRDNTLLRMRLAGLRRRTQSTDTTPNFRAMSLEEIEAYQISPRPARTGIRRSSSLTARGGGALKPEAQP